MVQQVLVADQRLDFGPLAELYGGQAIDRISRAWEQQFLGYSGSTVRTRFRDFCRFLRWIAARAESTPHSSEAVFFRDIQAGRWDQITRDVVFNAGEAWASRLRDLECREIIKTDRLASRRPLIESISTCLRKLARAGLWPEPGKLRPPYRGQIIGGNIPSLGELRKVDPTELAKGRAQPDYSDVSWKSVMELNERRLGALRRICSKTVRAGLAKFERGQAILADENIPTPSSRAELASLLSALPVSRSQLRSSFRPPEVEEVRQRGFAMMVRFLAFTDPHRRTFRDWRNTSPHDAAGVFGGWMEALAHLEGDIRTLIAAQALVMIETGFNVSTCDRLAVSPFVGSAQRGRLKLLTIAAAKPRAGGKIQEATIREETEVSLRGPAEGMGAVEAIRAWQKMSARPRATAAALGLPSAGLLWIALGSKTRRDRIDTPSDAAIFHHWTAMLRENVVDPDIGRLQIRRQMIRPTVLQLAASRGNFEHTIAARVANHSSAASTMRYLSRPWFKALLDEKMRRYLGAFEACLSDPIVKEAPQAALSEFHDIQLEHGVDTGLGFLCTAPRPVQEPRVSSDTCIAVDRCADCSYHQFRPNPQSIRALVVLQRSLEAQAEQFSAQNPARWAEVWLSFQALCIVITDRLRTSRHKATLGRIEEQIGRELAAGTLEMIRLW